MQNRQVYSFDDFQLDSGNRQLLRGGNPLPLSAKAFDLLQTLLEHNGRLVEKDELFNSVWRDQIVEESNLTVHISQIRKALGENKNSPRYIETVPGYGYRFVGKVEELKGEELVIETETFSLITIEREAENGIADIYPERGIYSGAGEGDYSIRALEGAKSSRSRILFPLAAILLFAMLSGGFLIWRNVSQKVVGSFVDVTIKQLTDKGNINWAIISPDGKFFAYTANKDKGDFKLGLWLAQTDGSNEIPIRQPEHGIYRGMAFSSDSKTLYFSHNAKDQSYHGTLYRMPVLGGVPEKILDEVGEILSLSPDDRFISFFRTDRERNLSVLVIANLDGSGEREVLNRPISQSFSSNAPAWSPDGSMLAFGALDEKKNEEIFTIGVNDGNSRQVSTTGWRDVVNIVWQPDGKGLITIAKEKSATDNQLWQVDYSTGNARRISRDTDTYGFPLSISADSRSLLVTQGRTESNIWLAPADDLGSAQQITFSSIGAVYGWFGLDWSPDGRIFFIGAKDQSRVIYSMAADGTDVRQITPEGHFDQRPRVSPDGSFIVFQSNRSGKNEIWRVSSDGRDLRQLTTGGLNNSPDISPDGKWIVYVSGRYGQTTIWRIPVEGGEPIQITNRESFSPRISPDGKFVACFFPFDDKNLHRLALLPIDGGEPVKLFHVPRSANLSLEWARNGNSIFYRDWVSGVWEQDVSGGEARKLPGLSESEILPFGWSRDGKLFAFTRGRTISDAVLISDAK